MPAYLLALYNQPLDRDAFEEYYAQTHLPLAARLPRVRSFDINVGSVMSPDGSEPFYRIAAVMWDSMDDLQAALASPEGQATAADLANFATGGVTLALLDAERIVGT